MLEGVPKADGEGDPEGEVVPEGVTESREVADSEAVREPLRGAVPEALPETVPEGLREALTQVLPLSEPPLAEAVDVEEEEGATLREPDTDAQPLTETLPKLEAPPEGDVVNLGVPDEEREGV
jgi:hypothetical protein